jgi:hypothetical protein
MVKGRVTDTKTGQPLSAVSISVVGGKTSAGVTTDEAGNFSIKLSRSPVNS